MPANRDYDEGRLLFYLRASAIVTIMLSIVFLVVVDVIGRLFRDPDFHVETAMFGSLVGALIVLIIPEIRQIAKKANGKDETNGK